LKLETGNRKTSNQNKVSFLKMEVEMARKVERSDKNANPILSMFKGMPKVFWIGMGIMYGWCFLFMIIEMRVPGFPLKKFLVFPHVIFITG
jgi:hypothetical protein